MTILSIFKLLLLVHFCKADYRLTPAKALFPGDELVSSGGVYALGFFSPTNTTGYAYVGIWYHDIPERTYVWVANRDKPIGASSSGGKLVVTNSSALVLSDSEGRVLWKVTAGGDNGAAAAVLLDTGNLVLQSANGTEAWQSFDHPTDTILPSFKLRTNYKTHVAVRVAAWKAPDDPSTGAFFLSGDPSSGLQFLIWRGTSPYWRSGAWSGEAASGLTRSIWTQISDNGEEIYSTYNEAAGSPRTHWKLDYTGNMQFRIWSNSSSSWGVWYERPGNGCLRYGSCGPFGYCDIAGAVRECRCLDGFVPAGGDISRGCVRKEALKCRGDHHFLTLPAMVVPDKFVYMRNRSLGECAAECSRNCSCTAYAYANMSTILTVTGTTGDASRCLLWTGELLDSAKAVDSIGENLYLRLAVSPAVLSEKKKKKKKSGIGKAFKILIPIISCLLILTGIYLVRICKRRGHTMKQGKTEDSGAGILEMMHEFWDQNLEIPCIRFEDIASATNNFHDTNMLGKGGFGKVYKATLEDGKEVAVKRLSSGSEQGIEQFRNEVFLIAKLQHNNLVRLLGCCIHGDEKLLIYEYLPNKSLEKFLFDNARKHILDWPRRFDIIKGVARGLLYLHQDSRMMIIHRDLKASNILLDEGMRPKIADFGMARIFGGNEQQANTRRVVGTYGYMSPEYAMEGIFSVKSDTYSFGILLLEIVSGLKISSPHHLVMDFPNLIACAWNLWKDGKARDFMDPLVTESHSLPEVLKCIHVGLLCVQDSSDARPLMSSVVFMLDNEDMPRAMPKRPIYFAQREDLENSVNNLSLTMLEGR